MSPTKHGKNIEKNIKQILFLFVFSSEMFNSIRAGIQSLKRTKYKFRNIHVPTQAQKNIEKRQFLHIKHPPDHHDDHVLKWPPQAKLSGELYK